MSTLNRYASDERSIKHADSYVPSVKSSQKLPSVFRSV